MKLHWKSNEIDFLYFQNFSATTMNNTHLFPKESDFVTPCALLRGAANINKLQKIAAL